MSVAGEMSQGEGTLAAAAERVTACRADFERMSAQLTDQLAALQGQWLGRGAGAFGALHQTWTDRHRVVVGALDRFDASLRATQRDVVGADEQQGSTYAAIAGRLGG